MYVLHVKMMDEETQKQILANAEKIYNKGVKDGKGELKDESKSENFKSAYRIAGAAAKKADDPKSSTSVEKLGKLVNSKFSYGKVPNRADIEGIASNALQVALGMPQPEKTAKPKEKIPA